ncbi:MAG TPA: ATP synthase F0 subunit B [Candidatus Babeliales bacterium]|nr:ATP synthase F0 subunit B [Candidatus Babeliales bacterium]
MSDAQLYLQIAIWSQVVSSALFIVALVAIWMRWILPVVLTAQARSNRQIAQAERHRDEVKAALETVRQEIESARRDGELIESRAGAFAERERQTLLAEAKASGERALADAAQELGRARESARARLREDLVERALKLAREEAARRVGPAFDAAFVDRFTHNLEASPGG